MVMEDDRSETNPYRSPVESSVRDESAVAAPRRFRWRVIPVTLLYLYGGGMLMTVPCTLFASCSAICSWRSPTSLLLAEVMAMASASLLLVAGRQLWKGRWRRGAIAGALGIALYATTAIILSRVAWTN
jgi:hypothetical protein